ncbi:MAG TPA: hypothetical protein PKO06_18835, partial [Candidatus Ozemobacteraceae bacterium]|nr:hypothetical protein [Candidatus Ozemobacteraceae bacterium]
ADVVSDCEYPLDESVGAELSADCRTRSPELGNLISDRRTFREFARARGLLPLEFWTVETFEQLSAVILKRERFPLCLKSRRNLSGGVGTYRIEGFRELSRFWERLQKVAPGPAIIEDWVNAQVLLEVTLVPDGSMLAVQAGLEQSLTCRTAWRMFPVVIPERWKAGMEKIVAAVKSVGDGWNQPLRLHLGLMPDGQTIPLALNGGLNRPEYLPRWSGGGWGGRALVSRWLGALTTAPLSKGQVVRLLQLRRPSRLEAFPDRLPDSVRSQPSVRDYAAVGRHALVMLIGADPKKLAAEGRAVATLLAAQEDSD